jgi:phenylpropionate dioxygenase-like ring-hydroxylating dioxygenase large terminal subunit
MSKTITERMRTELALRHQWFPVARSSDLSTPQAATLLGERLVVYRTAAGRAVVQSSRCPHRGADLSLGQVHGETIACPYHGWRYSGDTGRCAHVPSLEDQSKIPTKAGIRTLRSVERYAHVWAVWEDPVSEMYDFEEWHGTDFQWLAAATLDSPTGVAVAIENFADVAHFSFIHRGMMGATSPTIEPLNVRRNGLDVWMDRPLTSSEGEWAKDGNCMMHYHISAPGCIAITYDYEKLGKRIVAGFPSPMAYDHVRIFWAVANERGYRGANLEECLRIEDLLYREDLPTAASIWPREIDWDGEFIEFSVPSDLFTLNYRRAFREFVKRAVPVTQSEEGKEQQRAAT